MHLEVDAIGIAGAQSDDQPAMPSRVAADETATATERAVLRDGSSVVIRPLAAGEEASIVSWFASRFASLSPEKLYARSLVLLQWLDPRVDVRLGGPGRVDCEAIAALADDGVLVGIARRLRAAEQGSAEVTIAVANGWHGRGLGTVLLQHAANSARSAGIPQLTASCLATEQTLIRLLCGLGRTSIEQPVAGLLDLRIQLA